MALPGTNTGKCERCGAALPRTIASNGDRIDDLMRDSAISKMAKPLNRLCKACLATPLSASEPDPHPAAPISQRSLRQPASIVSSAELEVKKTDQATKPDENPIDKSRPVFTIPANVMQTDAGRYAVIGIAAAIVLFIVLLLVLSNDPVSQHENTDTVRPPPSSPAPIVAYKPRPKGSPGNWVTTNDYPSKALSEERQGTTAFRLEVSAQGAVTGCTITNSSGSDDLDGATCNALIRRAKFEPALDYSGKPVASMFSSRVRWQIPVE